MVITSGAPLPKANRVAPATAGESLRWSEMSSRVGQKNASDAMYMTLKRRTSQAASSALASGGLLHSKRAIV